MNPKAIATFYFKKGADNKPHWRYMEPERMKMIFMEIKKYEYGRKTNEKIDDALNFLTDAGTEEI